MAAKGETGTYSLKVSRLQRPVEVIWDLGAAATMMLCSVASISQLVVSDLLGFLT